MGRVFTCSNAAIRAFDVVAIVDIQVVQTHRFEEVILAIVSAAQLSKLIMLCRRGSGDIWLSLKRMIKLLVQLAGNVRSRAPCRRLRAVADKLR